MWKRSPFTAAALVGSAAALALLIGRADVITAQPPLQTPPPAQSAEKNPHREYVGEDQCLKCHLNGLPDAQDADVAALFGSLEDDSWVLYEEVKIWASQDKHSQAYTSLLNDRSKRMGELLGIADIHRDKRCLACHTGLPLHAMQTDPQNEHLIAAAHTTEDMRLLRGVGCEGCHGASGSTGGENGLPGWFTIHTSKQEWRFLDPQVKLEKYGYKHVRSPIVRAQICLSCHLGDAQEGRVVTHEMYAAGHPPLPGVELVTFIEQMPKHWRDLADKPASVRDEFLRKTNQAFHETELRNTRDLLVAAAVTLAESMKLTADLCDEQVTSPVGKPPWPDFAQYDCYACHHDLKEPAWRQQRTANAAPGRPQLYAWPTVLVQIALKLAPDHAADFERHMQEVRTASTVQPFGQRSDLQRAAREASRWALDFAGTLQSLQLGRDQLNAVRASLASTAAQSLHDYDSARQLVWAYDVLHRDVHGSPQDRGQQGLPSQHEDVLAELKSMFVLELKSGRSALQQLPGQSRSREVQEVDLQKTLPPIADYDPLRFQKLFAQLMANP